MQSRVLFKFFRGGHGVGRNSRGPLFSCFITIFNQIFEVFEEVHEMPPTIIFLQSTNYRSRSRLVSTYETFRQLLIIGKSIIIIIYLSLFNNWLTPFRSVERQVLLVADGRRAIELLLRLEASAKVDTVLQRIETVLISLAT